MILGPNSSRKVMIMAQAVAWISRQSIRACAAACRSAMVKAAFFSSGIRAREVTPAVRAMNHSGDRA